MSTSVACESCRTTQAAHYVFLGGAWFCIRCEPNKPLTSPLFEYGHENPMDPKGSTAHVRDIKSRRLDVPTGRMYRETPKRSYFFPK